MADITLIPVGYRQENDICLLASYAFVLGYYKNLQEGARSMLNVHEICDKYISYLLSVQYTPSQICFRQFVNQENQSLYDGNHVIKDIKIYEYFVSLVLHVFCQKIQNDIRGYNHIEDFDDYLRTNNIQCRTHNFSITAKGTGKTPINNAYQIISNHLDRENHNIAMALYITPQGGHSVMIAKNAQNNQFLFRDSNNDDISNRCSILNTFFSNQLSITEYLLFSLR